MKGFLSFVVAAVFLFSLVAASALVLKSQPRRSYEGYRAMLLEEVAIKRAYYSAVEEAGREAAALAAARAASGEEVDVREEVRRAAFLQSIEFEAQLKEQGFEASFWCGSAGAEERKSASQEMAFRKAAVVPQGALPIWLCYESYDFDPSSASIFFRNLGFSFYSKEHSIGSVALLPSSFAVGIATE
ncbi:MAG: hypothetical protein N3G22_01260 [Candidatus Micrarchaeota archaeon]|nr:hypothetical protein [Candidatus Micrarchaeota archaeon]